MDLKLVETTGRDHGDWGRLQYLLGSAILSNNVKRWTLSYYESLDPGPKHTGEVLESRQEPLVLSSPIDFVGRVGGLSGHDSTTLDFRIVVPLEFVAEFRLDVRLDGFELGKEVLRVVVPEDSVHAKAGRFRRQVRIVLQRSCVPADVSSEGQPHFAGRSRLSELDRTTRVGSELAKSRPITELSDLPLVQPASSGHCRHVA